MSNFDAAAEEYRIAYQQLRHAENEMDRIIEGLERDHALAAKRYEVAREAYVTLALGETDEFLKPED